jgi:carboxyl-terminal processing protease
MEDGLTVANYFVGTGTLVRVIGKGGKETKAYTAESSKVVFTGPLVVVTDRSTAGPAEIVAAAVKDQKRGEVVGERTFGTGSEQQLFSLTDGGALLVTTAKYAPNSGKPFMEEPVQPTVKVERLAETDVIVPDGDEEAAPDDERPEQPQAAPPKVEPPVEDIQLKKAIEVIKQASAKTPAAQKRVAATLKHPVPHGAARESILGT